MNKKKKMVIGIASTVSIILIVAAIVIAYVFWPSNVYARKIRDAEKLVANGDYANAVLAYQEAIEKDPENVEAYLSLADLYVSQGDTDSAITLLQSGLLKTGSSRIQLKLDSLLNVVTTDTEKKESDITVALNTTLLDSFSEFSFGDYSKKYGIAQNVSNGSDKNVRANSLDAELIFRNTEAQPEAVNASVVSMEAIPAEITLDQISSLFSTTSAVTYEQLKALSLQNLKKTTDSKHGNVVTFSYKDTQITIASDANGNISNNAWNKIEVKEKTDAVESVAVSGKIIDAQTGSGINSVKVIVRAGLNETGASVAEFTTDANGTYSVNLAVGQYIFEISANGFDTIFKEVYVGTYASYLTEDFTLSKALGEGEARIVLEWGATPTDLDSYLLGTDGNGKNVAISFRNRQVMNDGVMVAELDLDDTDGYGPETTTIYDLSGDYVFEVVDFLGGLDETIQARGATATVYLPNQSPQVISFDASRVNGKVWRVCRIHNGELEVYNDADPSQSPTGILGK